MAQIPFIELAPEVLSVAAACPTPTITRNARNAARELARRARCFRYSVIKQPVFSGFPSVELMLPCDTVLVLIKGLSYNGSRLTPKSPTILDADVASWRDEAGTPRHFMRDQNCLNSALLYPSPVADGVLDGEVAISPSITATGIEEIYLERFSPQIINGTLAMLLAIPSAPWFSPETAAYHRSLFEAGLDDALRVADMDDLPKLRSVKYGGG